MDGPVGGNNINDFSRASGSAKNLTELQKLAFKSKQINQDLKQERRKAFHEGMLDALSKAKTIHENILETGVQLSSRAKQGKVLSENELTLLKLAQQSAKEVTDRSIGKSVTKHEETHNVSFLSIIADASQRRQQLSNPDTIDAEVIDD